MPELADWMTPMDERILEFLERSKMLKLNGLWLKSGAIAKNISHHKSSVSTHLGTLLEYGLVERDGNLSS